MLSNQSASIFNWSTVMLCLALSLVINSCTTAGSESDVRPNIILIMADDMGYSDIACYGGEISTPNLDKLAEEGIRFTQFYNGARCCPTRASLLTGLAPHQAGMGWMTIRDLGHEGYRGEINQHCVTIAEVLKDAGYATFMTGKWHLTHDFNSTQDGNKETWPNQRGFDRFFGTILGAGNFYNPASIKMDNEIFVPDEDFFYTDAIATNAINFVDSHFRDTIQPFFLYMAYTAPHWPLHARDSVISKYLKRYEAGWDEIRRIRYEKMIDMDIINPKWKLSPRNEEAIAWSDLEEENKIDMIKRMATYAAQIDEMDQSIGMLIQYLKDQNQLNNTLILFLADNGGCAEFNSSGEDKSTEAIGRSESFESYRLPWANASNTPFKLFKHWTHEGGISTPLIAYWPGHIENIGHFISEPAQINDIMPTVLDVSHGTYPGKYNTYDIYPLEGQSLLPLFNGEGMEERVLYWEHEANRAIRKGKWKLVSAASLEYPFIQDWELYDMENDRTENENLTEMYPDVVEELSNLWEIWARSHLVYPLDGRDWGTRLRKPVINNDD